MRTVKEAQERRNEILDTAAELFRINGYEQTTTADILSRLGIARGTLYYHFENKESILDGIIERQNQAVISRIKKIAAKKEWPAIERFLRALTGLRISEGAVTEVRGQLHKPQNSLMHQKLQQVLVKEIIPLFIPIIQAGIKEGSFATAYPHETIELVIVYAVTVFDDESFLSRQEQRSRLKGFFSNAEKLLGIKAGVLSEGLEKMLHKRIEE